MKKTAKPKRKYRQRGGRPSLLFPSYYASPEAKELNKHFIKRLLASTPDTEAIERRLEILFLALQRRIVAAYVATTIHKMPGFVVQEDDGYFRDPVNGEEKLFVSGTPVFIRMDYYQPDRIDIELASQPGTMFCLTASEYKSIMNKFEEVGRCNHLLDPSTLGNEL